MDSEDIARLVERYYEGQSSLAEENQLREVFLSGKYSPEYAAEAEQFLFFYREGKEDLPDPEFDSKLEEILLSVPMIPLHRNRNRLYYLSGIAAGIIMLAGLFLTFRHDYMKNGTDGSNKDSRIAYAQAEKALLLLSVNLNTGLDNMQHFRHFDHGVKAMKHFSDFYKYQTIIINPNDNFRSQKIN